MLAQQIISGLAVGFIYGLVALGFVLIYKATEVINFAQGELMMLGAFIAYTLIAILGFPVILGIFSSMLFMAVFGFLVERLLLRRLVGEPIFSIVMVTIGLSIILRAGAGMLWTFETLAFPRIFPETTLSVSGLIISFAHLWIIGISICLVSLFFLFFRYSDAGLSMRATAQNQLATILMGISVKRVFSMIWAVSAAVAALSGILIAPLFFLDYNMGFIGLKAFPAAILGGFRSIPGAIVGGLILGVTENLAGGYLPGDLRDVSGWLILILVLMIRPEGIFGRPERKKV
jgi:branched-chain amino acid transport system permease protein